MDEIGRQVALEREMFQLGADRQVLLSNQRKLKRMVSLSRPGLALTVVGVDKLIGVLTEHRNTIKRGEAGRRYAYLMPLLQISPRRAAATAVRVVVDQISQESKLHAMAYYLADMLWMEAMLARASKGERIRHGRVRRRLQARMGSVRRMKNTVAWTPQERLSVGVFLIHLVAQHTGLIEVATEVTSPRRTTKVVRATSACIDWLDKAEKDQQLMCPFALPMVARPRDWLSLEDGGYYGAVPFSDLLKGHMDHPAITGAEPFVGAVNRQQSVAWKVNDWMLEQVQQAWDQGLSIGGLTPREGYEIPPYPKHLADDDPEVQAWKMKAKQIHEENDRNRNRRIAAAKLLWLGRRFMPEPAMYYPMQLDWRGRFYYRPPFLNPQGGDISRSLLMFANGKPITSERQADWLRVHGANTFGHSKLSWRARVDWVHEQQQLIEAVGRNPWGNLEFWSAADDPWQFLAFCREYQQFNHHGYGYVSRLPVVLDCTCSGIQHYAALLRSSSMANMVNLLASDEPQDIYSQVLQMVLDQVRHDAAAGEEHARNWMELQPDRSLAKQVVMTLPYSAGHQAVIYFCKRWATKRSSDLHGAQTGWCYRKGAMSCCAYMASILYRITGAMIAPAKQAMTWFKRAGAMAGRAGIQLEWTTPAGLRIQHKYMDYTGSRIRLYHLSPVPMELMTSHEPTGFNPKRMGNALSPNVIHSMDASHMAFVTASAFAQGIQNLGGIHDCFATTAAEMDRVRDCVRNSFADMYSTDWYTQITDELLQQLPAEMRGSLPRRPKLGSLDIDQVRQSNYFIT
jgi:DNA-directed RNA polymerase